MAGCSAASHRPTLARILRYSRRTSGVSVEVANQRSTQTIQSADAPSTGIWRPRVGMAGGWAKPCPATARWTAWNCPRRGPRRGSPCRRCSATGRSSAQIDVIISSSVDQLVKLVNDGCATPHRSRETAAVPDWAKWRDEVFGFTFEPALIVYNRDLVPSHQVPRTRVQLVELLRSRPELYAGKVVTYDVTQSGI